MKHCGSSELYRSERVTDHDVQFRASMLVMMYFHSHYRRQTVLKHKERVVAALGHIEARFHK